MTAREQARKAVFFANHPGAEEADWPDNTKRRRNLTDHLADAASDAWEPLLRKYGQHKWPCGGHFGRCDCGLREALGG